MRKGWTEGSLESYKKSMAAVRASKEKYAVKYRGPSTIFVLYNGSKEIARGHEMDIRRFLGLTEVHNDLLWKYAREQRLIQGYKIIKL